MQTKNHGLHSSNNKSMVNIPEWNYCMNKSGCVCIVYLNDEAGHNIWSNIKTKLKTAFAFLYWNL